jgi:hypothetical protein
MATTWARDVIKWRAEDLISMGYINSETEWFEFSDVLSETAMQFFMDKVTPEDEEN